MKHRTQRRNPARWVVVAAIAVLAHLVILGLLLPQIVGDWDFEPTETTSSTRNEDFEVSVLDREEFERILRSREEAPVRTEPEPEPEPEPEEPEEEPERKPPTIEKIDRKVVEQVTNEERPDEANFISQTDNKTADETRARDTTTEQVLPSREQRDDKAARLAKAEVGPVEPERSTRARRSFADPSEIVKERRETTETSESGELPGETGETGEQPGQKKRKLFEMTPEEYARVVGHQHDEAAHEAMQDKRLFAGWEEDEEVMRGALENFITEVKPGNHTSVNSHGRAWADYLGRIHRKIHVRWASGYLATLDIREDAGSPLNNPQLNTKLEFVIRASDGVVDRINIVQSSGELRFDSEAVLISKAVGPHPSPPRELVSPDGNVYVHWNFWRDQRQCGVFGASVFLVDKDEG